MRLENTPQVLSSPQDLYEDFSEDYNIDNVPNEYKSFPADQDYENGKLSGIVPRYIHNIAREEKTKAREGNIGDVELHKLVRVNLVKTYCHWCDEEDRVCLRIQFLTTSNLVTWRCFHCLNWFNHNTVHELIGVEKSKEVPKNNKPKVVKRVQLDMSSEQLQKELARSQKVNKFRGGARRTSQKSNVQY